MEGVAEEGAVEDGAAEGQFVGVFDFVAHAHASRQHRDFHIGVGGKTAEDVEVGGVALHCGTQRQYHLFHLARFHTLFKRFDLDVLRSDAVHRRDESAQHMIQAVVLMRVFDAHHIFHILHHTDGGGITQMVGADGANLGFADVVAHFAVLNFLPELDDGFAKLACVLLVLLQQMLHKAQRRFATDAREFGKFAHSIFQQRRCKFLFHIH